MARDVWITGYGLLSPLGETPAAWFEALGAPARWRGTVDAETYAPFPIHPVRDYALEKQVPKPGDQRAMGPLMQYGAYAAGLALEMAGIKGNTELLQETHIVAASGAGERDWDLDKQILAKLDTVNDRGAFLNQQLADGLRPTLFLAQLPNLFAGNISLIHGVAGSSRTFMGEESAGVDALRVAMRRCAAGQGDIFLVGGAFNAARPDIHQQYHAGGILLTGAWQPLWRRPEGGVALGSSGAFLVIEAKERAEKRGVKAHARLVAVESERTLRKPGAAAQVAEGEFARVLPMVKPEGLAILSGASGRGSITHEEREFLAAIAGDTGLPVRGTAAALGHAMECAFLQNVALAVASLERGTLFPPLDPAEPIEAEFDGKLRQVLVTSWGPVKGEGMALLEAIDGQ
jgi:3-oxoacyl-[acyl-carrier-protein] synthase II